MNKILSALIGLPLMAGLVYGGPVPAPSFTNGAAATDASIENVGPVAYAFDFDYGSTETINGVPYSTSPTINGVPFVVTDVANGTTYASDGTTAQFTIIGGNSLDGTGGGDSSDPTDIQVLNAEGANYISGFTLQDLTPGVTYAAEFIFNADNSDYRTATLTDNGVTSAEVTGGIPGPQYITDTFTAGSSGTESLTRGGSLQLSAVVVEEVPEPGTWAMMGLSLVGGLLYLVRRPLARSQA